MESKLLDALNEAQKKAVTNVSQNCLVVAGAGSGKTRVLTQRIIWLISQKNYSPLSILAVTFTNKAANEIKSRLSESLNLNIQNLWVGTFHGICYRILRQHFLAAKLDKNFQIIDSEDQIRLIKRILKLNSIDENFISPKQYVNYINRKKDSSIRSKDIVDKDFSEKGYKHIYQLYEEYCNKSSLVDFGELILKTKEILESNDEISKYYKNNFKEILVDEFQDTNKIQYELIKLFSSKQNSVFAVGDDDQSIYGWRGAVSTNMNTFQKEFQDLTLVRLEQNYRSTSNILNAANHLIKNNDDRLGKNLWTSDKSGEPIKYFIAYNDYEEAEFVIEKIKELVENEYQNDEISILYRSNAQSRILEEQLIANKIKYRIYGGLRFFERAEIKDILAYLRLAFNHNDDNSFERIINTPTRGIGEKTKTIIRESAKINNTSLFQSAYDALKNKNFSNKVNNSLDNFFAVINHIKDMQDKKLPEIISTIIEKTGIKKPYENNKTEQNQSKIENIDELVSAASSFQEENYYNDEPVLDAFLSHVSLESGEGQGDKWEKCVQLMTIHAAKGLEFPVVFLVGMEEGLFPSKLSIDEDNLSEERRLCYVGITRARKLLFLSSAELRRQYGYDNYALPSRFISEIPEELIEQIKGASASYVKMNKNSFYVENSEYKDFYDIGKRVIHEKFGEGIVTNFEGDSQNSRIEVEFDSYGKKWLLLSLANLKLK
ncbi:MAG: UvrD-helicase domain-containing protein [Pseudomonadota bacterium]|nr:UvrD-helicase domain-containing protein [Pseudomonadota bacterium]